MAREEMLEKLENIPFCAVPTLYTKDTGLMYDYVTPRGYGVGLEEFDKWPACRLRGVDPEKWRNIRKKTADHTLTAENLRGTDIRCILDNVLDGYGEKAAEIEAELWAVFYSLLDLPDTLPDPFYCLYDDTREENPCFFADRDSCKEAFRNLYCGEVGCWEDLDDDWLREWLVTIEEEMKEFPFIDIGDRDNKSI